MVYKDVEEYELSQAADAEEPLLPQHALQGKASSGMASPRRRTSFMMLCALMSVFVLLPSLGLAGCVMTKQKIALPESINHWLGSMSDDEGAFPTK